MYFIPTCSYRDDLIIINCMVCAKQKFWMIRGVPRSIKFDPNFNLRQFNDLISFLRYVLPFPPAMCLIFPPYFSKSSLDLELIHEARVKTSTSFVNPSTMKRGNMRKPGIAIWSCIVTDTYCAIIWIAGMTVTTTGEILAIRNPLNIFSKMCTCRYVRMQSLCSTRVFAWAILLVKDGYIRHN